MSKYMNRKELKLRDREEESHIFHVKINIHGRIHTEHFSVQSNHLDIAHDLGLFSGSDNYVNYFDWKPVKTRDLAGGVYKVNESWEDDRYFYVKTDDNMFSLPRYLRRELPREDYILFGKREK